MIRLVLLLSGAILLSAPLVCGAAPDAVPSSSEAKAAAGTPGDAGPSDQTALLRQSLENKRKELAKLRHKWAVSKGRTPTDKEIQEFEKKRAEGKAGYQDNPFINRSALQFTAKVREDYYRKKEEVRQLEEQLRTLEGRASGAAQAP